MRTLITILFLLVGGSVWAAEPLPPLPALPGQAQGEDAMPPAEIRVIRDIQNKAYGAPTLPTDAAKPEALLALSDLGSMAGSSDPGAAKLQQEDYDALFALLQRYRDDLLKMGMDGAELQAQMEGLVTRTTELERRLKDLHPRDGLKFFGRFFTVFDDLHLIGPANITANDYLGTDNKNLPDGTYAPMTKTAGVGMRSQFGVAMASIALEGTRGPVTAGAILDVQTLWGYNIDAFNMRRIYVEWRAPITFQFGDFDGNLSRLTLWRNDQSDPFEPLIFQERRQRMEDDLRLKPDQWPLTGLQASTDLLLFGSMTLRVDSITGIAAYSINGTIAPTSNDALYYMPTLTNSYMEYLTEASTYYQGWKLSLPLGNDQAWTVDYDGLFEWDEMDTSPLDAGFMPMRELVQSLDVSYKSGSLSGSLEGAMGSYQHPYFVNSALAQAGPMTGTAFIADGKWAGDRGFLRAYGRYVSSGFHASGAQGRTVDYNFQISGPFLTENSEFGVGGVSGFFFPGSQPIPDSYASRLNAQFIPAGIIAYTPAGAKINPSNPWRNLLNYGPGEEIDPYGAATPNRAGGGLEGDRKILRRCLGATRQRRVLLRNGCRTFVIHCRFGRQGILHVPLQGGPYPGLGAVDQLAYPYGRWHDHDRLQ